MTTAVHHAVVTLVQGASLYLWDLAENAPYHVATVRAHEGMRLGHGTVVRMRLEDGKPISVGPARKADLTLRESMLFEFIGRELKALAEKEREENKHSERERM